MLRNSPWFDRVGLFLFQSEWQDVEQTGLLDVYKRQALNNPGYKQITLSDGAANVSFNTFGNQRASDRYKFNPHTGKICLLYTSVAADFKNSIVELSGKYSLSDDR